MWGLWPGNEAHGGRVRVWGGGQTPLCSPDSAEGSVVPRVLGKRKGDGGGLGTMHGGGASPGVGPRDASPATCEREGTVVHVWQACCMCEGSDQDAGPGASAVAELGFRPPLRDLRLVLDLSAPRLPCLQSGDVIAHAHREAPRPALATWGASRRAARRQRRGGRRARTDVRTAGRTAARTGGPRPGTAPLPAAFFRCKAAGGVSSWTRMLRPPPVSATVLGPRGAQQSERSSPRSSRLPAGRRRSGRSARAPGRTSSREGCSVRVPSLLRADGGDFYMYFHCLSLGR